MKQTHLQPVVVALWKVLLRHAREAFRIDLNRRCCAVSEDKEGLASQDENELTKWELTACEIDATSKDVAVYASLSAKARLPSASIAPLCRGRAAGGGTKRATTTSLPGAGPPPNPKSRSLSPSRLEVQTRTSGTAYHVC